MKKLLTLLAAAGVVAGASAVHAEEAANMPQLKKESVAAVKGLVKNLKGQLKKALKEGGPVKAINVCKEIAPSIADEQSKVHNMNVARTALRVRNPDNAADDYERKVLEEFVKRIEAGEDPMKVAKAEIVTDADGKKTFRFMKAIPMGEKPCAACHGTNIKPEVSAAIKEQYPQDEAVGFKPGELRGAFTISKSL